MIIVVPQDMMGATIWDALIMSLAFVGVILTISTMKAQTRECFWNKGLFCSDILVISINLGNVNIESKNSKFSEE